MSRIIQIGSLRESVELLEPPLGPPSNRIGRIRHANGESASIDLRTLQLLLERARCASSDGSIEHCTGILLA